MEEKKMTNATSHSSYQSILFEIQDRISTKKSEDMLSLYLEVGRLALITEQNTFDRNDPIRELGLDLQRRIGVDESFSPDNLHKMKDLFLTYRVLIKLATDLKIEGYQNENVVA